jgi:hypothetical protein
LIAGKEDKKMSKSQRIKGFNFERAICNEAKAFGLQAQRSTCSFGTDVIIENYNCSLKIRKKKPEWIYKELEKNDCLIFRCDREKAVVFMGLKTFLELIEKSS